MGDDDVEMATEDSPTTGFGSTDGGDSSPTAHAAKSRKPTYLVRKEEKEKLMKELEELQIKLQKLQEAERQEPPDAQNLLQQELETSLLRDAVKLQQLSLVNVQSAVSSYVSVQEAVPHEVTICLSKDPVQRREALLVAKRKKIHSALAYLTERTRFLDPFQTFAETSRFVLDGGDYCAQSVETQSFDASNVSVRQLYNAVVDYFSNMEMRVTDLLGDITTCDETDYGIDGIRQSRYESFLSCGIPLEMNSVTFHEFTERSEEYGGGGPFGIFTLDFVDRDELYPYRPTLRVRFDITAVFTIRTHERKQVDPATGREEVKSIVVWTRSCFGRQRHFETPLPPLVENRLREQLGRWGSIITSSVLEHIFKN